MKTRRGDLPLPDWGPYTKAHAGVSHLPDLDSGLRFDLSVFPGFYRRRQVPPNVNTDSGAYAWKARPDLQAYTYRHALNDLKTLYADITYCTHDSGRAIETRLVNFTSYPQQLCLHWLASIHFPETGPGHQPPLRPARVKLPPGAVWIDGTSYTSLTLHEDSPLRHLPDNAGIWGEVRGHGFVNGSGLGSGFGSKPGHHVEYQLPQGFKSSGTVLMIRYRMAAGRQTKLRVTGAYQAERALAGTGDFQFAILPHGPSGGQSFRIRPEFGAELEINGCVLVANASVEKVTVDQPPLNYRPVLTHRAVENELLLRYDSIAGTYGLGWEADSSEVREWLSDHIDHDFGFFTHEHVQRTIDRGGERHYTNVFVRPVFLAPGETRTLHGFVCHDDKPERATARLRQWRLHRPVTSPMPLPTHTESGRHLLPGVERLSAMLSTNVVYPVRRFGRYIRHYTPGRWWDSFYTWDSGFIGLGLLELDAGLSAENLACYLTEPSEDSAFVHHGSPLPVQIYQLHELWNRTRDPALLRRFFPGARRMHRFLVGRTEGSRTRTLASGLLRPWDYFYNSGGWDDYPPQKHIRGTPLTAVTTPVVNTAHAIRTAKILSNLAVIIGEPTGEFDADIHNLTDALQRHSWNPASSWFSYVLHDEAGNPTGPLLHESGEDYNRGLDGIYPLAAGICTPQQETLFLQRLRDRTVFWTDCGLSTVDQSAPYFTTDGYWNGAVWMPHQWFIWKTLLDMGEGPLAWQIARTALETWNREVLTTGCCFEHFIIRTNRGAGWHQFGGLSSPILSWFTAYFRPGSLTGGHDMLILDKICDTSGLRAQLRLAASPQKFPVVLAVVPGATTATWNDAQVPVRMLHPGTLEIRLPCGAGDGILVVK